MNKVLYVFDFEKLDDFKQQFTSRNFVSIAFIFNLAPNIDDINYLDDFVDNCIIDITVLALENGNYRLFTERYLYTLIERFKNVEFSISSKTKVAFLTKYPYIFDEINEEYLTIKEENTDKKNDMLLDKTDVAPIPLLLYKQSLLEKILEKYQIVSIGSFFVGKDSTNYKLNVENIEGILIEQNVQYIDITQMVYTFVLRQDLILVFEIFLRTIQSKKKNVHFLISEDMKEELQKYLPFTFKYDKFFFNTNGETEIRIPEKSLSLSGELTEIIEHLTSQLKGHEGFKKDFSFNLKKFALLNKIKQRKIFSVFLTGESGIGKTEFAKILSEIMYPGQTLIKINFGNYSNEGVLNSLIGSPLGYIGSEEGGELINKMKLSKSKVILIDEFEKATPSVFHFFYELLEDGKFTDRHGTEHDLNGYIIVFTSNISKEQYLKVVPDSLKSRFDMVYRFVNLSDGEKIRFINEIAEELINKINEDTLIKLQFADVALRLNELKKYNNLRSIKRKVEDIVVEEYYRKIEKNFELTSNHLGGNE